MTMIRVFYIAKRTYASCAYFIPCTRTARTVSYSRSDSRWLTGIF